MRRFCLLTLVFALYGCSMHTGGSDHTDNKAPARGATQKAAPDAKVPDTHASKDPNAGRQAGVGDDESNLEVAEPDTGKASSGGRQAHATR